MKIRAAIISLILLLIHSNGSGSDNRLRDLERQWLRGDQSAGGRLAQEHKRVGRHNEAFDVAIQSNHRAFAYQQLLVLLGTASADALPQIIQRAGVDLGLALTLSGKSIVLSLETPYTEANLDFLSVVADTLDERSLGTLIAPIYGQFQSLIIYDRIPNIEHVRTFQISCGRFYSRLNISKTTQGVIVPNPYGRVGNFPVFARNEKEIARILTLYIPEIEPYRAARKSVDLHPPSAWQKALSFCKRKLQHVFR